MDDAQSGGNRNKNVFSISSVSGIKKKKIMTKARVGLCRKCLLWVMHIESDLVKESDRLRKLGVKTAMTTLEAIAKALIKESTTEVYNADMRSGRDNKSLMDLIGKTRVQRLMQRYNIVVRRQTEKLQISPEAQELTK